MCPNVTAWFAASRCWSISSTKSIPRYRLDTLRMAQGASTLLVKSSGASGETAFGQKTGVISVKVGRLAVPTDAAGRIWLYQTREQNVRFVPAWKILAGDFDRSRIQGSILFVGSSAAGLADVKTTPLHPALPGVAVHAQIAEQMILGSYLTRPDWATGAELIFLFIVGLILVLLIPRLGAGWSAIIGGVCIAFGVGLSWYAFSAGLDPASDRSRLSRVCHGVRFPLRLDPELPAFRT